MCVRGCNECFLERGGENLKEESFWVCVNEVKWYGNGFYGVIGGGVSVLDERESEMEVGKNMNCLVWGEYVVGREGGVWEK